MADTKGTRRRTELACTTTFSAHQRSWFAEVRRRVLDGEPFALLSADAPHEIYRAMDIPYVVIQWWSSMIAAKQLAPEYLKALEAAGYPSDSEQYTALPLGELLDDSSIGPWEGLPRPTILQAPVSTDGTRKLFEAWAHHAGADFYPIERSVDSRMQVPDQWWDELPHNWDSFLTTGRLDLMADELVDLIHILESATGRHFSESRLLEIMDAGNRQAEHNRAARDVIARSIPAPVGAAETMAATMIPQWHRGSDWGREAAAALRAEIEQRAASCTAAWPGEEVRLMWLGRGLWSSLGFYQRFQQDYNAVFVWSMYLALAADGYLRYVDGRDPLRALASRFVPMGEELRMPTWSSAWHVKEAKLHQVDGVISLGEDDYFSVRKLEAAGIPVLSVRANNVDRRTWNETELVAQVAHFIEERALPTSVRRRHGSE